MIEFLRNRKKPILGAIAAAVTYLAAKVGFELDPELAATIAGAVFALAVERLDPIFGEKVKTPGLKNGRLKIDPAGNFVDLPDHQGRRR